MWIGVGVATLLLLTGLVTEMGSVFSSTWSYLSRCAYFHQLRFTSSRQWRLVFAFGLMVGWWWLAGPRFSIATGLPWWQLLAGGFLAGFGAQMSNGCTSGHGIRGLALLRWSAALAALILLATAIAVAKLTWWLWGR